eukprot:366344-Chlamydomonas_euryale.AAC.10
MAHNSTYDLPCVCRPYSARGPLTAAPRSAIWRSNHYEVGRCIADRSYLSHCGTYVCRRFGVANCFN